MPAGLSRPRPPGRGADFSGQSLLVQCGLKPHRYDPKEALDLLGKAGFRLQDGVLYDAQSHAVEFSVITNAGNQAREKLAQMIQQDLKAIGIRLNVVKLDYSAIIDRISQSFDYESCLLGLTNVDLDPDAQMNVWLSSASNHQWNPNQASPATPWEAEIDRLMQAQGSELKPAKRKAYFDKVQEIVSQEVPFLYLVTKNALVAVSPALQNASPSVLRPQAVWNIEMLALAQEVAKDDRCPLLAHPAVASIIPASPECSTMPSSTFAPVRLWVWWAPADRAKAVSPSPCSGCWISRAAGLRAASGSTAGISCAHGEREMRSIRGKEIAFVPQSPASVLESGAPPGRSDGRGVAGPSQRIPRRMCSARCRRAIEQVGLPAERGFLRRYPGRGQCRPGAARSDRHGGAAPIRRC